MKKIKWGFIGCGEVVELKSGPAFGEIDGSEVVAVMSRTASKAKSYAERHGIKRWYTDAQELIDDPDVMQCMWQRHHRAMPLMLLWQCTQANLYMSKNL